MDVFQHKTIKYQEFRVPLMTNFNLQKFKTEVYMELSRDVQSSNLLELIDQSL